MNKVIKFNKQYYNSLLEITYYQVEDIMEIKETNNNKQMQ